MGLKLLALHTKKSTIESVLWLKCTTTLTTFILLIGYKIDQIHLLLKPIDLLVEEKNQSRKNEY